MDSPVVGPQRVLNWILDALYKAILTVAVLGIVAVVVVVSWQVLSRYVTSTSAPWAPEAAQLAFVWSAVLAIAIGVRQHSHLVVDAFSSVNSKTLNIVLNTITAAVVVAVSLVLVWYGLDSLSISFRRTFPSLRIAQGWMHLAIPVGFACCAVFALEAWIRRTFGQDPAGHSDALDDMLEALDESDVPANETTGG